MNFLDTNIFLYAGSNAPEDKEKREAAERVMREGPFAVSSQVVQEYISNALRKPKLGLGEENVTVVNPFL